MLKFYLQSLGLSSDEIKEMNGIDATSAPGNKSL
jgi:hypothetical protein